MSKTKNWFACSSGQITPELLEKIRKIKATGGKIGFACGVFDLFHAGHVLMLKECAENCDFLIVAINTAKNISEKINPGKKSPVSSFEERMLIMQNSKYVHEVLSYSSEDELLQLLTALQINVRFLGDDYRGKPITGEGLATKIYYIDRGHGLSSSLFRKRLNLN